MSSTIGVIDTIWGSQINQNSLSLIDKKKITNLTSHLMELI